MVHSFCNVQILITNGSIIMGEDANAEIFVRKEYVVFRELLQMVQKGTKGMKGAIVGWITPKGQILNSHIHQNDPWNGFLHSGLSVSVFSHTDLITNSEHFYTTILKSLDDPKEDVHLTAHPLGPYLIIWHRQVFPLYTKMEFILSKNSTLARIHQKHDNPSNNAQQ
ncbi:hypothetical protein PAXRUDRAFT_33925 [Paxillus rubicundulus Ve08.2h10]|uniref:Uncharacterized protein n=1 Tax=Paxillus rubicundulus Ve08.2h10 TaxID=930991 RepID=A0A0D0DNZ9_9AGAM|nr:hypothetical protein PAXRUDRAFT_33925 [Paxillus rubicundulus Ve08.2h10]